MTRIDPQTCSEYLSIHPSPLPHSRNASTLTSSDLLALIVMVQNMYPSNIDLEDTAPEVGALRVKEEEYHTLSECFRSLITVSCVCRMWRTPQPQIYSTLQSLPLLIGTLGLTGTLLIQVGVCAVLCHFCLCGSVQ